MANKGNLLYMLKMLCDHSLKKYSFHNFSSSGMYILPNKYFYYNIFKKTLILTGCREYLYISVCIWHEDSFTQIKLWNAHEETLRARTRVFL